MTTTCAYETCRHPAHDQYGLCTMHAARRIAILDYRHRCAIPCEVCGREEADLSSGRCKKHKGKIACEQCGRPCTPGRKTKICADCYTKAVRVHRACADCGGRVSKESKSGRCRDCYLARRYADHRKKEAA